jgi:hypothetical protein
MCWHFLATVAGLGGGGTACLHNSSHQGVWVPVAAMSGGHGALFSTALYKPVATCPHGCSFDPHVWIPSVLLLQCTVIDTLHAGHARETIAYMKADELSQYQVGTTAVNCLTWLHQHF